MVGVFFACGVGKNLGGWKKKVKLFGTNTGVLRHSMQEHHMVSYSLC
jgi:hypothetical protein